MARPRSIDPASSWSFWLPLSLIAAVDRLAGRHGQTRNAFVRQAVEERLAVLRAEQPDQGE